MREKDALRFGSGLLRTIDEANVPTHHENRDDTVIQSQLTMKDEPLLKLETDKELLPREGTAARLVIEVK